MIFSSVFYRSLIFGKQPFLQMVG